MNAKDRGWFEGKFSCMDKKFRALHDDVLIIKTERKIERKLMVAVSGAVAFAITAIINWFGR